MTGLPLTWLAIACTTAVWEKVFSTNPQIGFLAGATAMAEKLAAGQRFRPRKRRWRRS